MSFRTCISAAQLWLAQPPTSVVPDPQPRNPGGAIGKATDFILGLMMWGGLVGAVGALIAAGVMMVVGRRNRNNLAIDGAMSLPWILAGLALVLGASSFVTFFLGEK